MWSDLVEVFRRPRSAFRSSDRCWRRLGGAEGRRTASLDHLPPCRLTLASAVSKGERFDWLVEKATELGVERLIPIVTDRSVVEPGVGKLSRLRRSIIEASKQCRRNRLVFWTNRFAGRSWRDLAPVFRSISQIRKDFRRPESRRSLTAEP